MDNLVDLIDAKLAQLKADEESHIDLTLHIWTIPGKEEDFDTTSNFLFEFAPDVLDRKDAVKILAQHLTETIRKLVDGDKPDDRT